MRTVEAHVCIVYGVLGETMLSSTGHVLVWLRIHNRHRHRTVNVHTNIIDHMIERNYDKTQEETSEAIFSFNFAQHCMKKPSIENSNALWIWKWPLTTTKRKTEKKWENSQFQQFDSVNFFDRFCIHQRDVYWSWFFLCMVWRYLAFLASFDLSLSFSFFLSSLFISFQLHSN